MPVHLNNMLGLNESSDEWMNYYNIHSYHHCQLAHQYKRKLTSIELLCQASHCTVFNRYNTGSLP